MMTVNVHEAKTHLSRLLERVRAGEEVVIAKGGVPCARLVPIAPGAPPKRQSGTLRGAVKIGENFFDPLPPKWTGEG
jgi:prevent-host-death family protein